VTDAVLCVDIGTTSLKAGLVTANGEVVSICSVKFNAADDKHHIARKWLPAFNKALIKLSDCSVGRAHIVALSISGNGPTVVTEDGTTVLWNDSYAVPAERTGFSLFLPKIIALKETFPAEFADSAHIFSGPEYLIWQLTGSAVTILPEARFEGAYWNNQLLEGEEIGPDKLPGFFEIGRSYGTISLENEEIPVFGAGPDFVAALIGTNTLVPGRLCDRSGSSEGLNFCVPEAIRAEGVRTLPSVIPGLWNISCLIPRSGRMPENQRLEALKRSVNLLKRLAGQYNVPFPDEMLVTGGQTKNAAYMWRKARALGINLVEANCDDAELLGDACVAWYGLGTFKSLQDAASAIVREGNKYESV
jgi:sugar (pentulose or hexulose) kinase